MGLFIGDNNPNNITGSTRDDIIDGKGGDDFLNGLAGKDEIKGGKGKDTLLGGSQDDVLKGGEGKDFLQGEEGNDTLDGGKGSDRMSGGNGDDKFVVRADDNDVVTDFVEGGAEQINVSDLTESDLKNLFGGGLDANGVDVGDDGVNFNIQGGVVNYTIDWSAAASAAGFGEPLDGELRVTSVAGADASLSIGTE